MSINKGVPVEVKLTPAMVLQFTFHRTMCAFQSHHKIDNDTMKQIVLNEYAYFIGTEALKARDELTKRVAANNSGIKDNVKSDK